MQRKRAGIIYPLTTASNGDDVVSSDVAEMAEGVQQRIRDLAYLMWESAGRQHGLAIQYWLAAEKEVVGVMQAATKTVAVKQPASAPVAEKQAEKPAPKKPA
jgi:hypothetical protein